MNMETASKEKSVKELKKMAQAGDPRKAFEGLKALYSSTDSFALQASFVSAFRLLDKATLDLKKIRVALLSNYTTTHLREVLEFSLAKEGFEAAIYEADYGTMRQTILDSKSALYSFDPEITFLFTSYRDINFDVPYGAAEADVQKAVVQAVGDMQSLWQALRKNSDTFIIQNNADLPASRTLGNFEATAVWSPLNLLRRFNLELAKAVNPGVALLDLDYISSFYGKKQWQDMRYWYHSKHLFAFDAMGLVAHEMAKTVVAIKGQSKKCIVLDLDNTLWGGVIADDGLEGIALGAGAQGEAFVDFQKYLLALKARGIILTVCSKNEEELAKEPFLKHPQMPLKLEDISVFVANWNNKADNIKEIASSLNIGLDAIVLIDDNPAERLLVRQALPDVTVLKWPEDPSNFVKFLSSQACFETIQFSAEDGQRSAYYSGNVQREQLKNSFENLDDYLQSLEMECSVGDCDEGNIPRIVQLINKTNQFNLTTIRYSESEFRARLKNRNTRCRHYQLRDRFGDNGLIAVVILDVSQDRLTIDSWLMSCRVLSRGMEEFICKDIIAIAKEEGCPLVVGQYIPTKKNKLVADLFARLGFVKTADNNESTTWELSLKHLVLPYKEFIKRRELDVQEKQKALR